MDEPIHFDNLGRDAMLRYLEFDLLPSLRRHVAFKLRFSGQQEIENIVQEAIVRVIEHRGFFEGRPVLPWAYRVANNLIVDHWRLQAKAEPLPEQDIIPTDRGMSEKQILIKTAFDEAFRQLTDEEQQCLYLDAIGKTDAEISEQTGIPLTTVVFRLKTARQKLRDNKKFEGIYSKKAVKHEAH